MSYLYKNIIFLRLYLPYSIKPLTWVPNNIEVDASIFEVINSLLGVQGSVSRNESQENKFCLKGVKMDIVEG